MKNIPSLAISFFIGAAILLTEFGNYISHWVKIPFTNTLWEINQITNVLDGVTIFAISFILLVLHFLAIKGNTDSTSFRQGLLSGFLAIPLFVLALGVAAAIFWLVVWIFKILFIILSFVAIPLVWLIKNVIVPIISFIGIPFIWLWENALLPIIKFIGIPFVWLFENLLIPVFAFLFSYVIKPVLLIVAAIASGLIVSLPFIAVGYVFRKAFDDAFAKNFDSEKIFSYGVGLGFFYFEMVCNCILFYYGVSNIHPSLLALFPFALSVSFLINFVFISGEQNPIQIPFTFRQSLSEYWKKSKLEFTLSVCLIPISLALAVLLPSDGDQEVSHSIEVD